MEARECLHEAARIAADTGVFRLSVRVLAGIALLMVDQSEAERAVELYALVSRYGYVANSRWFEDVLVRPIADAVASLPPDAVSTAEERGRERDLHATVKRLLAELDSEDGVRAAV